MFMNFAGKSNINPLVCAELTAAGIPVADLGVVYEASDRREVKTRFMGDLHGWSFQRAWSYWIAEGPGLPLAYAQPLYEAFGQVVRVDGHCGCPSPLAWFKGFGVGCYHVDTAEGLKALADALSRCVEDAKA